MPFQSTTNIPKYRLWSPTSMANALQSIREENMSVRKAAKLYNVPLTTLRDRVDGRVGFETIRSGPETLFTQEEEARLSDHIVYMASLGYGYTRAQVLELATDLAVHMGKREKNQPLSMFWFYDFMSRWPNLNVSKPRGLASIRAKSASPDVVDKYYTELKHILTKYDLADKPECIYNLDEKGISTEHNPPNVVASRGTVTQAITSPRAVNTTIIGCGNALGQQIPPYYIFSGQRMRAELLNGGLPGTDDTVTETGWSNSEVLENYIRFHLKRYVKASPDNPVIVLFDGHASHLTISVIEFAKSQGIILFVFPPHCSHILQPMDVGCFGPLSRIYNSECSSYLRRHKGQVINRLNVCEISSKAYSRALSPENLRSAFRKSGVYPLNSEAIDPSALAPHVVFASPLEQKSDETVIITDHHDARPTAEPTQATVEVTSAPALPVIEEIDTLQEKSAEEFFALRDISNINPDVTKTKRKRKTIHPIVSGKAITEDDVIEVKNYKQNQSKENKIKSTNKKSLNTKQLNRKSKNKPSNQQRKSTDITYSPQPGPSAIYVNNSDDFQSSDGSDDEADSSKCCVCHKNSPPDLRKCIDLVIVKWAQCDKCQHWTHLRFCSSIRVVRRHSEFLCPCCEN